MGITNIEMVCVMLFASYRHYGTCDRRGRCAMAPPITNEETYWTTSSVGLA